MTRTIVSMHNPATGEAIEPIGFRANGNPIFPLMGGAPDDDGDGDAGDDAGDDDGSDGNTDDEGDGTDAGDDGSDDDDESKWDPKRTKAEIAKRNAENAALRKRMKAAEEAAAKWAEHEKSKLSKEERLAAEASEKGSKAAQLEDQLNRLKIAVKTGLSERQVARLVGEDYDTLLADAEEFIAENPGAVKTDPAPAPRKTPPAKNLKGGLTPGDDDDDSEMDPIKLASRVSRGF